MFAALFTASSGFSCCEPSADMVAEDDDAPPPSSPHSEGALHVITPAALDLHICCCSLFSSGGGTAALLAFANGDDEARRNKDKARNVIVVVYLPDPCPLHQRLGEILFVIVGRSEW